MRYHISSGAHRNHSVLGDVTLQTFPPIPLPGLGISSPHPLNKITPRSTNNDKVSSVVDLGRINIFSQD